MPQLKESNYPQEPILVDGYYPATLKDVTEYTKVYDGKETERLAWIFDVEATEDAIDDNVEVEVEGWEPSGYYEIAAHTGITKSTKSNSNWFKLDMNVIVPEGCENTDDLIGTRCIVNVSSFVSQDGLTKNSIDKIRPKKREQKGEKAQDTGTPTRTPATGTVDLEEEDFADLPFAHLSTKRLTVEGII